MLAFMFVVAMFLWEGYSEASNLVRLPATRYSSAQKDIYYADLIELALSKSTFDDFKIVFDHESRYQAYNLKQLEKKRIDIVWTMTSLERENKFLPIRIPLLKGALGYRICMIHRSEAETFEKLQSLNQFKESKIMVGQGHDWPDIKILQQNEIRTTSFHSYEGLFRALRAKRFDCFARGIHEIWDELSQYGDEDLVADKNIVFQYYSPSFFFVHNSQEKLAQALRTGLSKALEDGSFDLLFERHWGAEILKADLKNRLVIRLKNKTLSKETAAIKSNPKFWLISE